MANTKGLGKGLSALLGDDVIAAKDERASSLLLPISQVESCSTLPERALSRRPSVTWRTPSGYTASSSR